MTSMGSVIAENRQLKGPHNALAHGNFKERDHIPPPNQGQKQSRFREKAFGDLKIENLFMKCA